MILRNSVAAFFNLAPILETTVGENIIPASDPGANYKFFVVTKDKITGHPVEMASSACSDNNYANIINGDLYIATLGTCNIGVEIID